MMIINSKDVKGSGRNDAGVVAEVKSRKVSIMV